VHYYTAWILTPGYYNQHQRCGFTLREGKVMNADTENKAPERKLSWTMISETVAADGTRLVLIDGVERQYVYTYRADDADDWAVFAECPVGSITAAEVVQFIESRAVPAPSDADMKWFTDDPAMDAELHRWQEGIRDKIISCGVPDDIIDGAGCDSGDPLDFTLTEVGQGLNYFIDQLDELRKASPSDAAVNEAAREDSDQKWRVALRMFEKSQANLSEVAQCAQAILTALNVGDIQSESALHLKLRKVMIAYRKRISVPPTEAGEPK
jgi:hypothetical protein